MPLTVRGDRGTVRFDVRVSPRASLSEVAAFHGDAGKTVEVEGVIAAAVLRLVGLSW